MSEKNKRKLERLLTIANLDLVLFKSIGHSLLELYDTGIFRVYLAGPRIAGDIPETNRKLLTKRFNIDMTKLHAHAEGFLFCIHYVIRKEVDEMYEFLKENKEIKTAEKLREKTDFVGEVLKKHPQLRQGYLAYTFSKLYNFQDMEWEADFKVFQSPSEFLRSEETPLLFPSSRVRLILRNPAISPVEPTTKSSEFEISAKDLDFLVRSLQDLREALRNLEKKKLVDK